MLMPNAKLRHSICGAFVALLVCASPLAAQSAANRPPAADPSDDVEVSGLGQQAATQRADLLPEATMGRKVATPLARINNRIENRIQSRISNRVDATADTDADPRSPVEAAERRLRASVTPDR